MTQKTVFVCFFPAYPPTSGAAAVTYASARHAAGERVLIQMGGEVGEQVAEDGLEVVTLPWPGGRWGKVAALGRRVREVARRVAAMKPDVVVLEGASWAMYHWLLLRQLRRACEAGVPVWYHGHNVEYVLRKQKHGRLVSGLTRWAEGRLARGVDRVFAVSDVDRQQMRELYSVEAELWPNGVAVERFAEVDAEQVATVRQRYDLAGPVVLFMGMYEYQPNREALDFLVTQVMPRVREELADARLLVLGGDVPYHADWLIKPGRVPHTDLPAIVKACNVGAAPIFSGSGTRLKILEYLAAGLPVVATAKGAEGLDLEAGACLVLAEAADFSDALVDVLKDRDHAAALGQAGQHAVRERYDWHAVLEGVGLGQPREQEATA